MDERKVEALIENEREWRRFVVEKIGTIEERLAVHMAWQLVFRIAGTSAFALIVAYVEFKK
jgi:hypothetical protein